MNRKEYSSNGTIKTTAMITAQKVVPAYNRYYERIKAFAQQRPKKTIAAMLLFATLNFLLMVYVVNSRPATSLIPKNIESAIMKSNQRKSSGAPFSISNYMKITKLKDSLDYLIKLPSLTKSDSLLFIRICDEYSKLDPAFSKQVKEAIHKKNNPNHENDNH